MATKYGELGLKTPGGVIKIPIWEISDVCYNPLRVKTPSGIGAINLVNPGSSAADTPLKIKTASGIKAISTQPPGQTVDDFEDGGLGEYMYPGGFSVVNAPGRGGQAIRGRASDNKSIISRNGLSYYPNKGDTIRFDIRFAENGTYNFYFAQQSDTPYDDHYAVRFKVGANEVEFYNDYGAEKIFGSMNHGLGVDNWIPVEIEWRNDADNSFKITVENESFTCQHAGTPSDGAVRNGGGIGFAVFNGTFYVDNLRVGSGGC